MQAHSRSGDVASSLRYRPDIDGLRAAAVIPVVLYHAKVPGFSGGFVGVDVFFVISGFLITSLIVTDAERGRFSIVGFYERRVRRILPALFTVIGGVTVAATALLLPRQLESFGTSVVATTFFTSNLLFWTQTGYFEPGAGTRPLLHMWSLAVEEQFYLLFPLYVVLVRRWLPRKLAGVTAAVALASFALSVWAVSEKPSAAFYLAPPRAWELLLGSLLAMMGRAGRALPGPLLDALGVAGLAMIGWSVVAFSPETAFPGASALLPCVGAAAVIGAGQGRPSSVGRLLSARPLVFVGLISYSLYLWHFPLLVFARYVVIRELTPVETSGVVVSSFAVAALSWRFVESPFRGRKGLLSRRRLFASAGATAIAMSSLGLALDLGNGWPGRLDVSVQQLAAGRDDYDPDRASCAFRNPADVRARRLCTLGAKGVDPRFAVWGDSHADVFIPVFREMGERARRAGLFLSRTGCVSLFGVSQQRPNYDEVCLEFGNEVRRLLQESPELTDVVLISRWAIYGTGLRYRREAGKTVYIRDGATRERSLEENRAVFRRGLERTLRVLDGMGKRVFLVASVPEVGWPVPEVLARAEMTGRSREIAPTLSDHLERQAFFFDAVDQLRGRYEFTVLSPHEWLCVGGVCAVRDGSRSIYYDNSHLTTFGARRVGEMFAPLFEDGARISRGAQVGEEPP